MDLAAGSRPTQHPVDERILGDLSSRCVGAIIIHRNRSWSTSGARIAAVRLAEGCTLTAPAVAQNAWLICTCEGTVTGFSLANPKLAGEREQARTMLERQPANRPRPGTAIVTDKGLSGEGTEEFFARPGLDLALIRPARKDESPRYFPNWLRQRVEAIIWTLKNQLGLERHGGRVPNGLWARITQRLLALNAAIWFNWQIGAPVKRSLIAYDH
jgi:hypothetical protein